MGVPYRLYDDDDDDDDDGHDSILVIMMTLDCQGICVAIKFRQSGAGKAVLESAW